MVGPYQADFYNINGLQIETKKRREHLTEDDVQSNKALIETFKKSIESKGGRNADNGDEDEEEDESNQQKKLPKNSCSSLSDENLPKNGDFDFDYDEDEEDDEAALATVSKQAQMLQVRRRKSLTRPQPPAATWQDYVNAPKGKPPCLGRAWKSKESTKTFKATLAMSRDFPLSIESLLNVLEVVAPFKHFSKLRQFVELNLPPGFPVKIGKHNQL